MPLFLSMARRVMPALAGLSLLSGCATVGDQISNWIPEWSGGEGKTAQKVHSRAGETAPVPVEPSRKEIMAVQADLAELG